MANFSSDDPNPTASGRRIPGNPLETDATLKPVSILTSDRWADHIPHSDHVEFFKNVDWGATHLGPLSTWSIALRLQTFTVFADTRAAVIYW